MQITLVNDFHDTTANVRTRNGRIGPEAWRRALRKLCPLRGHCACGAIRGVQPGLSGLEVQEQSDGSRRVVRAP